MNEISKCGIVCELDVEIFEVFEILGFGCCYIEGDAGSHSDAPD